MRTNLLKWLIETAVPFLNLFRNPPQWPFDIKQHRMMPEGSLGNAVAVFLDEKNLPLLPKYEIHDVMHVLLGYGITPFEEIKLQAFMIGNGSSTFAGKVLFVIGLLIKPEYTKQLLKEMSAGKKAKQLSRFNFSEVQTGNLVVLRNEFDIKTAGAITPVK